MPSVDTPSLAASPSTTPLNAANQDLRLFHWLGNSTSTAGLAALQQFQYKKETSSSSMKTHKSPGTPPLSLSSIAGNEEKLPDSPRSQDSAYFSQPQSDTSSGHKEEVPTSYQNVATSVCLPCHHIYKCLNILCGWVRVHTYSSVHSFMAHKWVCRDIAFYDSSVCLSSASPGNDFIRWFGARAECHMLGRSRKESQHVSIKGMCL